MKLKTLLRMVSFTQKNNYELLEVNFTATQEEIKNAYLGLAKKYHPDSPEGDEERFKIISEAYQTLKNEEKRLDYDKTIRKASKVKKHTVSSTKDNDVHTSAKDFKKYTGANSGLWSGGKFQSGEHRDKEPNDISPADVFVRMGIYGLSASAVLLSLYILYLLIKPYDKKEKLTRPEGITTKLPERSSPK